MNKIEIRKALHGWIIAYWKDYKQVEEIYTFSGALADRVDYLAREMNEC